MDANQIVDTMEKVWRELSAKPLPSWIQLPMIKHRKVWKGRKFVFLRYLRLEDLVK